MKLINKKDNGHESNLASWLGPVSLYVRLCSGIDDWMGAVECCHNLHIIELKPSKVSACITSTPAPIYSTCFAIAMISLTLFWKYTI